jgi:hypothetical protein
MFRGGGIDDLSFWYVGSLDVTYGEDNSNEVPWKNNGANKWIFVMPEGDVTVQASFVNETPDSDKLSFLSVSRADFTQPFTSTQYSYLVEIPHIFEETPKGPTFFINARTEDPNADVRIEAVPGGDDLFGKDITLVEGATEYKITVTAATGDVKNYALTVSYEPDLTLGAVMLETEDEIGTGWERRLGAAELAAGSIPVLWQTVFVSAQPNAENVELSITKPVNETRTFAADGGTARFDFGASSSPVALEITARKLAGSKEYAKTYPLNIARDCRADGGDVSIIKQNDSYYEVHTFTSGASSLIFRDGEPFQVGQVLVVAGGGGGGSGHHDTYADGGGGGGGGGVGYSAALVLTGTTSITVGAGVDAETTGNDSSFGGITVKGGGKGGSGYLTQNLPGGNGGSGGGGGAGGGTAFGEGGTAIEHGAVYGFAFYGSDGTAGSTGTAGGAGGSADFSSDISGTETDYGKGGIFTGGNADDNIGSGGGGAPGTRVVGGKGGSGVVIVRFPAKAPVIQ